jgi:lambda repressor-like predicted transcriptional regulator
LADLADLCSNPLELPFTPVELRKLAELGGENRGLSSPAPHRPHELSRRLGTEKVAELAQRAQAGESVRSLAREVGVANSALTRMLREQGVAIEKRKVSGEEAAQIKAEYESGATMRELEGRHGLSHGAVFRALKRPAANPMRPENDSYSK